MTPDEQIAVIQARARGEKIEFADLRNRAFGFIDLPPDLDFNFCWYDYRIAKPVPKKMHGYLRTRTGELCLFPYGTILNGSDWTRAQWLDGEVEE